MGERRVDAIILDMDGVVTRTAKLHARAWKRTFDAFLEARDPSEEPFDVERDYARYVDGRPRYDGVDRFLRSRDIELPRGAPTDDPERNTVCGVGNRKNRTFLELVEREGVEVFDDAVTQIDRWRACGLRTAIVSASKNCRTIIERAGLADRFDALVDGLDVERHGLDGKEGIFRTAAARLDVDPDRSVVVEDSPAGVEAGVLCGFARVVGVARSVGAVVRLRRRGADPVVDDMRQLPRDEWTPVDRSSESAPPPSALERFGEIVARLRDHRLALFLDYDGTLTPIVDRPEDAVLRRETRRLLESLGRRFRVAIVSGRDREDVEDRVGVEGLIYAGSHGFDIAGPDGLELRHDRAEERVPDLDRAESSLRDRLEGVEGVAVERKAFAIAVHYRRARDARDVERARTVVSEIARESRSLVETSGKKIVELRPDVDWDKGKAVGFLLEALDLDPEITVPMYIGDDETDEDAFGFLRDRDIGIGILVGPPSRSSAADYYLDRPETVHRFLDALDSAFVPSR